VSPHRAKRPWQGQLEDIPIVDGLEHDPHCYLCPGNKRSNGEYNPSYITPYSFENDFGALLPDVPDGMLEADNLLIAKTEKGICKVICFSPKHNRTLPELSAHEIQAIILLWIKEYKELGSIPFVNYVQIFENKGAVMGCSNPHPHGQIWAQSSIPMEPLKKLVHQQRYFDTHKRTLLSDYAKKEQLLAERIVYENESFLVTVPFWATWPFETMISPKRPMGSIDQMTENEIIDFAKAIKAVTIKYDNLFEVSFPYSAGIHQAPTDGNPHSAWHWHMVFYPPLLRSPSVKKFMVGYEMLANPQRDITPEFAAEKLRSVSDVHYKKAKAAKTNFVL
jgi:UDPglucose--hexose-1-phosphate uridylyltransferase